ncbi:Hypothetical predicted protein, partial [Scomber scombrus]
KRGLVSAPQMPCPRVQQRQSHPPQGRESVIGQLLQEQGCPSSFLHYAVGGFH